jgi:hypothetical protein
VRVRKSIGVGGLHDDVGFWGIGYLWYAVYFQMRLWIKNKSVVEINGHENRLNVVKTVWAFSHNVESNIDLSTRAKRKGMMFHV